MELVNVMLENSLAEFQSYDWSRVRDIEKSMGHLKLEEVVQRQCLELVPHTSS